MTEPEEPGETSVLASLPRARPQRRSAKRDAAPAADRPRAPSVPRKPPAATKTPKPAARVRAAERPPIAPQGYEADTARGAVEPPSRTDLVGSVVQSTGDLARIGLDAGRQVVRALLDRLPRP